MSRRRKVPLSMSLLGKPVDERTHTQQAKMPKNSYDLTEPAYKKRKVPKLSFRARFRISRSFRKSVYITTFACLSLLAITGWIMFAVVKLSQNTQESVPASQLAISMNNGTSNWTDAEPVLNSTKDGSFTNRLENETVIVLTDEPTILVVATTVVNRTSRLEAGQRTYTNGSFNGTATLAILTNGTVEIPPTRHNIGTTGTSVLTPVTSSFPSNATSTTVMTIAKPTVTTMKPSTTVKPTLKPTIKPTQTPATKSISKPTPRPTTMLTIKPTGKPISKQTFEPTPSAKGTTPKPKTTTKIPPITTTHKPQPFRKRRAVKDLASCHGQNTEPKPSLRIRYL